MEPDDPGRRLRAAYDALAHGDVAPMQAFLDPAVVYHLPGRHLGGGTLRGRDAVFARLAAAAAWCDAPPAVEVVAVVAVAAFVVSLERLRARRAGRTLDADVSVVWRLAGGRCIEIWAHFADQPACDACWEEWPSALPPRAAGGAGPLDLVIFDCDGVLVDSERLVNRIESECLGELGLTLGPDEARALFKGKTVEEMVAMLQERIGRPLHAGWIYDWAMATARGFAHELREVADVRGALDALVARGVPICVASQSPRARVELVLRLTDLAHFFGDRIYTASMVARGKPAPDLFLHAAAQCGARPEHCAVVEDSPSGVAAARAAGMRVFGYAADEDEDALAAAGAVVFHSMAALVDALDGV